MYSFSPKNRGKKLNFLKSTLMYLMNNLQLVLACAHLIIFSIKSVEAVLTGDKLGYLRSEWMKASTPRLDLLGRTVAEM